MNPLDAKDAPCVTVGVAPVSEIVRFVSCTPEMKFTHAADALLNATPADAHAPLSRFLMSFFATLDPPDLT